jgi:hypothetical protein
MTDVNNPPMCADVQITFRRTANILCRRRQITGADAVLTSSAARNTVARYSMNLHLTIGPIVSLVAGILILVVPRLLNYIVAIYLIIIGLVGLVGSGGFHVT